MSSERSCGSGCISPLLNLPRGGAPSWGARWYPRRSSTTRPPGPQSAGSPTAGRSVQACPRERKQVGLALQRNSGSPIFPSCGCVHFATHPGLPQPQRSGRWERTCPAPVLGGAPSCWGREALTRSKGRKLPRSGRGRHHRQRAQTYQPGPPGPSGYTHLPAHQAAPPLAPRCPLPRPMPCPRPLPPQKRLGPRNTPVESLLVWPSHPAPPPPGGA